MEVGDYVAKITNEWQKHNRWMEFPDEKPTPLGVIVSEGNHHPANGASWRVLLADSTISDVSESHLEVLG